MHAFFRILELSTKIIISYHLSLFGTIFLSIKYKQKANSMKNAKYVVFTRISYTFCSNI